MSPHVVQHLQLSTSSVYVDRHGCLISGHGSFFAFTGAITACGQFSAGGLMHGVLKPYFNPWFRADLKYWLVLLA